MHCRSVYFLLQGNHVPEPSKEEKEIRFFYASGVGLAQPAGMDQPFRREFYGTLYQLTTRRDHRGANE
ncbi:MAG: hypothetical protein CVV17_08985, partial [Gammaproteobacteria bacterium HGW-Gammaproteobacteria-7]